MLWIQNISGRSRIFRLRGPRTLASFRYSWGEGLRSPALNPPLYPLFVMPLSSGTQNRFQVLLTILYNVVVGGGGLG